MQTPEQEAAGSQRQGKKRGGKKQAQKVCNSHTSHMIECILMCNRRAQAFHGHSRHPMGQTFKKLPALTEIVSIIKINCIC